MTIGIALVVPASNHKEILVGSGNTQYLSVRILNPNDGVAYVARNRDCLSTNFGAWDWKIPSQSYAILGPGPWQTIGLYYLDQAGGGLSGEFIVYPSLQATDEPFFNSIGRAVQAFSSNLDVTQGTQPANPGVGITRIWIDSNGDMHLLNSNGQDNVVYDSSNIGTVNLGGDVVGTLANTRIELRTQGVIRAYDFGGTLRVMFTANQSGYTDLWNVNGNFWRILNQAGSVALFSMDNTGSASFASSIYTAGNLTIASATPVLMFGDANHRIVEQSSQMLFDEGSNGWLWRASNAGYATKMSLDNAGNLSAVGKIGAGPIVGGAAGDLSANRGNNTGYVCFADGSHYLGWAGPGTSFNLSHSLTLLSGDLLLNQVAGQSAYATYYNSANTQHRLAFANSVSLTNTNVMTLIPSLAYGNLMGLVLVIDINTGNQGLYWLRGGAQNAVLIHGQGYTWTTTFGSAGANVNFSGSASNYVLENKTGATMNVRVIYLGII